MSPDTVKAKELVLKKSSPSSGARADGVRETCGLNPSSGFGSLEYMNTSYTIGELARASAVPTSTVRYYERIGLVNPEGRSEGDYRLYGEGAVRRLRFIRAAQATGFTLEDISALLKFQDGATACCKEVQALIEQRLADVRQRLGDLRHVQSVLKSSLAKCQRTERPGHCEVLDRLNAASLGTGKRSGQARP
jgi:DNA-binding transcriptional MerR regulator